MKVAIMSFIKDASMVKEFFRMQLTSLRLYRYFPCASPGVLRPWCALGCVV